MSESLKEKLQVFNTYSKVFIFTEEQLINIEKNFKEEQKEIYLELLACYKQAFDGINKLINCFSKEEVDYILDDNTTDVEILEGVFDDELVNIFKLSLNDDDETEKVIYVEEHENEEVNYMILFLNDLFYFTEIVSSEEYLPYSYILNTMFIESVNSLKATINDKTTFNSLIELKYQMTIPGVQTLTFLSDKNIKFNYKENFNRMDSCVRINYRKKVTNQMNDILNYVSENYLDKEEITAKYIHFCILLKFLKNLGNSRVTKKYELKLNEFNIENKQDLKRMILTNENN